MTGVGGRPEVILEGANSLDGPWVEYEFPYKPGSLDRMPPYVSKWFGEHSLGNTYPDTRVVIFWLRINGAEYFKIVVSSYFWLLSVCCTKNLV